ncbi:MAG: PQQ-binding-like beta-propeller repeat protein [Gemmataceae bacterium]
MRRRTRSLAAALLTLIALALAARSAPDGRSPEPPGASIQQVRPGIDWPGFGGSPARNMANLVERGLPVEWETGVEDRPRKNIKWVAKLGSRAFGGPTIARGQIYVGTNNEVPRNARDRDLRKLNPITKQPVALDKGVLMCFRESDGKFLWQHVNDKLPSSLVHDWPHEGVCSTPTAEGNRVWYVSNRCEVVCLDAEGFANGNQGVTDEPYQDATDADVLWRYDMMKHLNVFPHNMSACAPLIVGDTLFVITSNGVDEGHVNIPSPNAPSFIALDKNSGALLWKDSSPGKNIMHGQWAHPAFANIGGVPQVIFPGGDGWLRAFAPTTGQPLWQFDCNPKDAVYKLGPDGTRSDFIAAPVIYEGKVYIGVGQDPEHTDGAGHLWCINPAGKSGDISPELVTDAKTWPPRTKPNPNSGLGWHFGGPDKNPNAQREFVFGRTMSTCAIHDGLLYAAELYGFLHCLDAQTGKLYWQHDLKGAVWGSPMWADGKVYVGTGDGDVWVFRSGREKRLLAKVEMEQPIRTTPIAAHGVLYIMTESNLYAIEKKAP